MKSQLILTILLLLTTSLCHAVRNEYELKNGEKILMNLNDAIVNVTLSTTSKFGLQYQEQGEELLIEKKDQTLFIKNKSDEPSVVSKKTIELTIPAQVNFELHLLQGTVQLQKVSSHGVVHVGKGKVVSKEGRGPLIVHMNKGEVVVDGHKGQLVIDAYSAQAAIKNSEGNLEMNNFSGDSEVEKFQGSVRILQNSGAVRLNLISGSTNVDLVKSTLVMKQSSGRITGKLNEGSANIEVLADTDVNLKSQSGRVNVVTPTSSAVYLNLFTSEGDLALPAPLKINRAQDGKSYRGKMRGDSANVTVTVKSEEGTIIVK